MTRYQRVVAAIRAGFPGRKAASGGREVRGPIAIPMQGIVVENLPDGRGAVAIQGLHPSRVGSGGTTVYSGKIRFEEFNKDLENDKGYGSYSRQGVYDKMRKQSAQVKRALWLLKLPMLAADPEVEVADDGEEEAEIADLVSYNLFEVIRWHARMAESLTMFEFGFSSFEALSDVVEVPRDRFRRLAGAGKAGTVPAWLFTDFEPRPAKTVYQWVANPAKPTEVLEMVQWNSTGDGKQVTAMPRIPGSALLRFTWEQEASNFQGISLLRPIYKPYVITDALETVDGIRHERQNCGIPVIRLPENTNDDDIDKAQEFLLSIASHEKAFLVLPFGWEFKWDTSGQGRGTDIEGRLEQLDRRIASAVLADFMTLGSGGDTGSYALAETQADRHLDLITFGARVFLEVINRGSDGWSPVKRIVDWNYGVRSRYPKVCFKNLRSKDDWAAILPLLRDFMNVKALGRPTYAMAAEIVRRLNLSPTVLPPEAEFEQKPEPAPVVGTLPKDSDPVTKASTEAPFGPYENFADCVAKNQDKADPEAYCGTIQRETE